jgi:hypothetical protein
MRRRLVVLAIAVSAAGLAASAHVTVPAEFREIVEESTVIARGLVTDVRSVAVPGRGIDSLATVAVESTVKGDAPAFMTVRVPGGQIGSRRVVMVGAPTLRAGDRAVFMLKQDPQQFWRPVGLSSGIHRVRTDAASGRQLVTPPFIAARSAAGPIVRGATSRQPMRVEDFEALVRTLSQDRGRAVRRGGDR